MADVQRDSLSVTWTQQSVVTGAVATLVATPAGTSFNSVDVGPKPIQVMNVGPLGSNTGVTISKTDSWINVVPTGHQDAANLMLSVSVAPGALADGLYSGSIILDTDDPLAANLVVPVTLELPGTVPDEDAPGTSFGDLLFTQLEPAQPDDAERGHPLRTFARALGAMGQDFHDLASSSDGRPGMTRFLDVDRAQPEELPFLGQWVGVSVPPLGRDEDRGLYAARERRRIREQESSNRGTVPALIRAVQRTLTGNRTVIVRERDGSPYRITVITWSRETPSPVVTEAAARSQKYAGLILTYSALSGQDFLALRDGAGGRTFQTVRTEFATFEAVRSYTPPGG